MSFVNEIVSEDNINKYDLFSVWKAVSLNKHISPLRRYGWTIDRERNVFFIPVCTDKEELSNQKYCALWWDGELITVILNLYGTATSNSGNRHWELVEIIRSQTSDVSEDDIKKVLKEALLVYGYEGAYMQIPNYEVTFSF